MDIINSFRIASYWVYKVAKVVKVVDVYHRRSPLVQGGLEPAGVCRDGTNWPQNEVLVQEKYKEPINGQIWRCHSYYP